MNRFEDQDILLISDYLVYGPPVQLLYELLARCIKTAARFNTNSPVL